MDESRKIAIRETLYILIGVAVLTSVMFGVYALLGRFNMSVILGGVVGAGLSVGNFFFMAVAATLAADKAEKQDVKGGQALVQMSYFGRTIGLFLILVLCAKTGIFNLIALVIPLVFTRPILTITDHFNKKGGNEA